MPNIDWRKSSARTILLDHLENGTLSLDENLVSAEEAWSKYHNTEGFKDSVGFAQFKRQLKAHREQVARRKSEVSSVEQNRGKPIININWRDSLARIVLLGHLESGVLSLHEKEVSVEEAWEKYRDKEGFKDLVEFSQFKRQLKAHREQVRKKKNAASVQENAMMYDIKVRGRNLRNNKGELKFDYSDAKGLLREDVKNNNHLKLTLTELWNKHEEYQLFPKAKFAERIRQEERRKKFVYWMNLKRELKVEKAIEEKRAAKENIANARKKKEQEISKAATTQNGKRRRRSG